MYVIFIVPALLAFIIAAAIGPFIIPFLRRVKAGQTVRDEGPETHLKKTGTPTMGGFIFLLAFLAVAVLYMVIGKGHTRSDLIFLSLGVFGFAVIGFIDDYIKVVLKRSMGLRAWQKFALQIILTVVIIAVSPSFLNNNLTQFIPFVKTNLDLGMAVYPLLFVAVLGTVNGANFTDGLDGLATKVTVVIAVFFMLAAYAMGSTSFVGAAIMTGALLGFLLYNSHKASVFMGDTGSLALGGFVIVMAMELHLVLYVLLIAFIYLIEVASVILQVGYFKITHGKRIFKMAPIHHHFELMGWTETKVVAVFTITTVVLCAVAALGF